MLNDEVIVGMMYIKNADYYINILGLNIWYGKNT